MNKFIFHSGLSLMLCLGLATAALAAKPSTKHPQTTKKSHTTHVAKAAAREHVTIDIWGADTDKDAVTLNKALADNGMRTEIHEAKGKPYRFVTEVHKTQDLSKLGKAVASAKMPEKSQNAPALDLVIYAPLTKETAQQAMTRLEQLKGVDAKHSVADIKNGELNVRVAGTDHVSASDIYNAVHSAGIEAHFTKTTGSRQG